MQIVAWAVLFIALFVVGHPLGTNLTPDPGTYLTCASVIDGGGVLYRDVWDNKGPVLHAIYYLIFKAFGYNLVGVWLATTVFVVLLAAATMALATAIAGARAGLYAAALIGVALCFPAGQILNGEIIMELLVVVALWSAVAASARRRSTTLILVSGICTGLATLTKQSAIMDAAAIGFAIIVLSPLSRRSWQQTSWRGAAWLVGIALVWGATIGFFAWQGATTDFWNRYVVDAVYQVQATPPGTFTTGLRGALTDTIFPNSGFWVVGLMGIFWCAQVAVRKSTRWGDSQAAAVIVVWLLLALAGVASAKHFFPHYFVQVYPALAVAGGWALAEAVVKVQARTVTRSALLAMVVLLLLGAGWRVWIGRGKWRAYVNRHEQQWDTRKVGDWLRPRLRPEDTVFTWAHGGEVYFLAHARPASRFVFLRYLAYAYWERHKPEEERESSWTDHVWRLWEEDMQRNRPRYIVVTHRAMYGPEPMPITAFPRLAKLIETLYAQVHAIDNITIYERITDDGRSRSPPPHEGSAR